MKKFEYTRVQAGMLMKGNVIQVIRLNAMGREGWELVTISNWDNKPAYFYFKREISQAEAIVAC